MRRFEEYYLELARNNPTEFKEAVLKYFNIVDLKLQLIFTDSCRRIPKTNRYLARETLFYIFEFSNNLQIKERAIYRLDGYLDQISCAKLLQLAQQPNLASNLKEAILDICDDYRFCRAFFWSKRYKSMV